jgi:hypothetical protein
VRTAIFSQILRDSSFNIASSGNVDTGTRDVMISVALASNQSQPLVQTETIIHNVYNN